MAATISHLENGTTPLNSAHTEVDSSSNIATNLLLTRGSMDQLRSVDSYLNDAYAYRANAGNDDTTSWWNSPQKAYWIVILSLGVCNSSDATEILALSYVLGLDSFLSDILNNDLAKNGGILAGAIFLGMLLGGALVGILGDEFGRRKVLLVGLLINAAAGLFSAMSTSLYVMASTRLIAGIGIGTSVPPLFSLAAELAPSNGRGVVVTVVASFWMVGSIFVSVVGFLSFGAGQEYELSWRAFLIFCAVPSLLGAILLHQLVPESPRFLVRQGRYHEAALVVNDLAKLMGYDHASPLTAHEIEYHSDFEESDNREGLELASNLDMAWDGVKSVLKLYTGELAKTTVLLQVVYFCLSFGSYGLMTWINAIFQQVNMENLYFNAFLFALANLPGNLASGMFVDSIGRKMMLVWSMSLASLAVALFAMAVAMPDSDLRTFVIVFNACAFQAFAIAGWNVTSLLSSEHFPTQVRSTGLGICISSGRIASMVAQFVNGALIDNPVRLLLVSSFFLLAGAMAPLWLPFDMSRAPLTDSIDKNRTTRTKGLPLANRRTTREAEDAPKSSVAYSLVK